MSTENTVAEQLPRIREVLSMLNFSQVGFVKSLTDRWQNDMLHAEMSPEPVVYAKIKDMKEPLPLIMARFYDSSDDDSFSPEEYEFEYEKGFVFNLDTKKLIQIYSYRSENATYEYEVIDGVTFFKTGESGQLEEYLPQ
ncbi:MAG: hypothetical protein UX13_C0044G0013 [Candidatus Woesebacteria bacterium GW2011_GWB1_45_5]|uniref:Uncharacterized protein n=1 Tax=Candidatus Woesebacteria bacterium GW2011_GWB1_45_5 TaxID=1618581 RepID=A0A0G1MM90_9BACT|nr:MAG: hypothetical protein UX13_C0044G0013 [Candidatus Woesebacteria bacterium GW2011_GWB1_45_5]